MKDLNKIKGKFKYIKIGDQIGLSYFGHLGGRANRREREKNKRREEEKKRGRRGRRRGRRPNKGMDL